MEEYRLYLGVRIAMPVANAISESSFIWPLKSTQKHLTMSASLMFGHLYNDPHNLL